MTVSVLVLGVDPGASGALAWLNFSRSSPIPELIQVADMPTLQLTHGRSQTLRSHMDPLGLANLLRHPILGLPDHAFVEEVHAMPKDGNTSAFRFGFSAGVIQGVLAALHVPVTLIPPQSWKPAAGLRSGSDKDASRARVLQLFPKSGRDFARKSDHGRADAVLLAAVGGARLVGRTAA